MATIRHLLNSDAKVVALARSQSPELLALASIDLLIIECDVFVDSR